MLKIEPARAMEPKTTIVRRSAPPMNPDFRVRVGLVRPKPAFADPDGIRFISFLLCPCEAKYDKTQSFCQPRVLA
jgi:hypothetical protein